MDIAGKRSDVGAGSAVPVRLPLAADTARSTGCASGRGRSRPLPDDAWLSRLTPAGRHPTPGDFASRIHYARARLAPRIATALRPAARRLGRPVAHGTIAVGG